MTRPAGGQPIPWKMPLMVMRTAKILTEMVPPAEIPMRILVRPERISPRGIKKRAFARSLMVAAKNFEKPYARRRQLAIMPMSVLLSPFSERVFATRLTLFLMR